MRTEGGRDGGKCYRYWSRTVVIDNVLYFKLAVSLANVFLIPLTPAKFMGNVLPNRVGAANMAHLTYSSKQGKKQAAPIIIFHGLSLR